MTAGRLTLDKFQKGKIGLHVVQALFTFIALCVLIAMFAQKGKSDGRGRWYIALCFLSVPAWVYLIMAQMWERTVKFANVFAMVAIDVIYTIFWLSAIIALGVWVNEGKHKGAKDKKIKGDGNCTTFAYGTEKKCNLAVASVGLGVPIMFLWIASSAISVLFILKWKKGEGLPWLSAKPKVYQGADAEDAQGKGAWSTDIHDVDGRESDDERLNEMRTYGHQEDEHELLHSTATEEGQHPGRPWHSTPSPPPPTYRTDDGPHRQDIEQDYQRHSAYGPPRAGANSVSPIDYDRDGAYSNYRPSNPFNSADDRL